MKQLTGDNIEEAITRIYVLINQIHMLKDTHLSDWGEDSRDLIFSIIKDNINASSVDNIRDRLNDYINNGIRRLQVLAGIIEPTTATKPYKMPVLEFFSAAVDEVDQDAVKKYGHIPSLDGYEEK